jgi:hypothetical protein
LYFTTKNFPASCTNLIHDVESDWQKFLTGSHALLAEKSDVATRSQQMCNVHDQMGLGHVAVLAVHEMAH